jgi:DNA polymerase elongation subunit (family B)
MIGENGLHMDIVCLKNERDMLMEFARRIRENDPTFITGFNDSSFDLPFLVKKLEMYGGKVTDGVGYSK